MKKFMKKGFVLIAVLLMLMVTVFADDTSEEKNVTVNGYDYRFWSSIGNNVAGRIYTQTTVCLDHMDSAPLGYMGGQARLYSSAGVLKKSSEWEYNTWTEHPSVLPRFSYETSSGYYYSKGQARFYTGNGYATYACTATPNYAPTRSVAKFASVPIQRNGNGEIYGSEIFLGEMGVQPDLILAEGTNGKIGYVRAKDMDDSCIMTPEQAMLEMVSDEFKIIPLYSSDGITVIGSFVLEPVEDIVSE